MDLRYLRSFVTLAEILHFGQAAEQLHIAQPALTQHIQRLEKELSVRLFERNPRKVSLTPVGAQFLIEARAVLAQVERAILIAARAQRGEVGHIEITYVSSMMYSGFLPRLLDVFKTNSPDITMNLTEADQDSQFAFLAEGRSDVALIRLPTGELSADFNIITLKKERIIACLREGHHLAGRSVTLQALAAEPFLTTHHASEYGFYGTTMTLFRQAGLKPNIVGRSPQFVTIMGLVAAGRGVALIPESVSNIIFPGVIYAELDECHLTSDLAAVFRTSANSPATDRLMSLCAEMNLEILAADRN